MIVSRRLKLLAATALTGAFITSAVWAADPTYQFDIGAQSLSDALKEFSQASAQQIIFADDVVRGRRAPAVRGAYTSAEALDILLAGTNLIVQRSRTNTIMIKPRDERRSERSGRGVSGAGTQIAAQTNGAQLTQSEQPEQSSARAETASIEEVIVTAQKRAERLQDVPAAVAVIPAADLLKSAQVRLKDYYTSVPSLNLTADSDGSAQLAIRGVTTGVGQGNPTVSVLIDDVPFGSSSSYGGGIQPPPDLDPGDLARIEVLRGPQGTLYGASSIGGLVKFVTAEPSTDGFSGRVQADLTGVAHSDEIGYGVRGSVNIPITPALAIRASAFDREDPGYIDNVVTREEDINDVRVQGGRLSASLRSGDQFSLNVSALIQDSKQDAAPTADLALGGLRQSNIPNSGQVRYQTELYAATMNFTVGDAEITSVTSYGTFDVTGRQDYTKILGILALINYGVRGIVSVNDVSTEKRSQEIRVAVPVTDAATWRLGAFYTDEDSLALQDWFAENPITGALGPNMLLGSWPTTFREHAAFSDVSWQATDRLEFQAGVRWGENHQTYSEIDGGNYQLVFYGVPGDFVTPEIKSEDSSATYLLTAQYKFSRDVMAYARFATGYRPGGPNATCVPLNVPCYFEPDTTKNYELGSKGTVLDGRLKFDASIYNIDWKNIQLAVAAPAGGAIYNTNASAARSRGVEVSLEASPIEGLTMAGWLGWNDASLVGDFPADAAAMGFDGDRLPRSSKWSGSLSVTQNFPVGDFSGFIGGTISHSGDRLGNFRANNIRQLYPAFTHGDVRAGIEDEFWDATVFVRNIGDKRGAIGGGIGALTPGITYIQPRTFGISVARRF